MGLMGLIMACYLGLYGILSGLTKSTDHPSTTDPKSQWQFLTYRCRERVMLALGLDSWDSTSAQESPEAGLLLRNLI